jgi:hypothetical protein
MKKLLYKEMLVRALSLIWLISFIPLNFAFAQNPPPPLANTLNFKSTFDHYKSYTDEKITPWKAANDEVGKIGGWRAYQKEANEPATLQPPEVKSAKPAAPAGSDRSDVGAN